MAATRVVGDAIAFGLISSSPVEASRGTLSHGSGRIALRKGTASKLWNEQVGGEQKQAKHIGRRSLSVVASRAGRVQPGGGYGAPTQGGELYLPFQKPTGGPTLAGSPDEHMEVLRDRRGQWYEFAPLLSGLYRLGYTSQMLDEATGLTSIEQNTLIVGAQVYGTLKESELAEDTLAYFEVSDPLLLYELRVLSVSQRKVAAEYVRQQRMDGKAVKELSRAIKDHERMRGKPGRDAFSTEPGDCLAFAYYRNAKECRRLEERTSMAEKGIALAVTDSARAKLATVLNPNAPVSEVDRGLMQVLRLTIEETNPRVIPVAGRLSEASPTDLLSAPAPDPRGPYRIFTSPANCSWVALPSYSPITKAASPAALTLNSATELPPKIAVQGRKDEPILLVVDRADVDNIFPEHYYVMSSKGGQGLSLLGGSQVKESEDKVLARVLLALRPPLSYQDEDTD
eukprot:TRINITY_DN14226_c0_g1_i1.p1 TRINITY_DN14226_c0_g1~~TRINITY_DN14226_c0_g1_i1.p1  ORF type:complete len:487 (+),score=78.78 TRINITY_DN14226_c0_g1_i1:98-1462(+)